MADELEELLKDGAAPEDKGNSEHPEGDEQRSEVQKKRIRQILSEREAALKERDDLKNKVSDLEFSNNFKDQVSKYPLARDHESDIREYAKKGISVEDATLLVLKKNDKLLSPEEIRKSEAGKRNTMGGSAETPVTGEPDRKSPETMTQAERLQALKEAEAAGEITLS